MELGEYPIRLMSSEDEAQLQALFELDPDYFKLVEGAPPGPTAAKDHFGGLPDGKEYCDKFDYGVFDSNGALIAVIELVRGYPNDEIWFLGLLFVAPASRSKGLGSRLLEAICAHVGQRAGLAIRLCMVRNGRARALYDRAGFRFICEHERACANGFTVKLDILERALR
jgi:GNAT superfamily N-acetyltransferase